MLKLSLILLFLFNFQIARENDFQKEKEIIIKEYYKEIPDSIKVLPFKTFIFKLDRYTRVLDKEHKLFYTDYMLNRSNGNIGVIFDSTEQGFEVYSVYKKSSAYKYGVERGDVLLKINGVIPQSEDDIERLIKGEVQTPVSLNLKRGEENIGLSLMRETIAFDNIYTQKISRTGIIRIENFHLFTHMEFVVNSEFIEPHTIDTLIIDLRDNSGGLLRDCLSIADEFIDDDILLISRISRKDTLYTFSEYGGLWKDIKHIIVLQNSYSASASEILASILQKNKGAIVIGDTSYGKGLVQTVLDFEDKIFIVTSSEYFTLGENKIHEIGVIPDKSLKNMYFEELPKNFNLQEFREKYPKPSLEALKSPLLKGKKNVSHLIWETDGDIFEVLLQKPYN